jgi:hypothetical protein
MEVAARLGEAAEQASQRTDLRRPGPPDADPGHGGVCLRECVLHQGVEAGAVARPARPARPLGRRILAPALAQ